MVWPTAIIPTYGRGVWLECNGQSFEPDRFPQLYKTLGTTRVPDYQGVFLRGYGTAKSLNRDIFGIRGILDNFQSGAIGEIQGDAIRNFQAGWHTTNFTNGHDVEGLRFRYGNAYIMDASHFSEETPDISFFYDPPLTDRVYGISEQLIPLHPHNYKYTISCSSSGGDEEGGGSTSCELNELVEDFLPEEGFYRDDMFWSLFGMEASTGLPTAQEIRPVNMAVKFMIKAK